MDFSFTDEQHLIAETFDRFCDKELSYDYVHWMDENVDFPPDELWTKFADLGVFAATVPVEYGGQGLGLVDSMLAHEQICKRSMSVALAIGATTGFGTRFHTELGTEEQKQRYLPRLAEGRLRTAMALTESGGGTDILGALSTFAEDTGDSWVINGNKVFITGAQAADVIFTVCRTERDARRSVVRDGAQVSSEEIIEHCRQTLAGYKCPKRVTFLESLPKTVVVKISRKVIKEQLQ